MFYKISSILVLSAFLTACAAGNPVATATPTSTLVPTSTQPPPTEPPIPSATPTEVAPVLQLDKPLTEVFDPLNKEAMPGVTGNQVSDGLVANTIDAKWRQDGIYDARGNVILPAGVMPVKPGEWQKKITEGGLDPGRIQLFWPNDRKMKQIRLSGNLMNYSR